MTLRPLIMNIHKRRFNFILIALISVLITRSQISAEEPSPTSKQSRPNIVLILSDDAGYSDFSFRGSKEIKTPNLDTLCKQGVEFTQAYSPAPVCTPSRAGILTGRHPSMIGAEKNLRSKLYEEHLRCGLTTEHATIAELLKEKGYSTALIGKWHLGYGGKFHPNKRGFDRFYGVLAGSRDYVPMSAEQLALEENIPHRVQENGQVISESNISYLTDQLTDEAIKFIQQSKEDPFFLYLSYTAVHSPYQAKQEDLDNHPHMQPPRRKIGAMVSSLDQSVGRVMKAIDEKGIADNTLFVFTNDNGGTKQMSNVPYRGFKGSLFEGGIRVPFIARMPGRLPSGEKYDSMVSLLDLYPTCLAAAGVELSSPCDGANLLDFVGPEDQARAKQPHDRLFFKFHSQIAIRKGDYKYYLNPKKDIDVLFNIADDPYEKTNLLETEPDRASDLREELEQWREQLPQQDW